MTPAAPQTQIGVHTSRDGSRLLLPVTGALADARTGTTLATLPVTTKNPFTSAFLHDGRIVIAKQSRLHIFSPDGRPEREIALPVTRGWISGEAGGKLIVHGSNSNGVNTERTGRGRHMLVIDVTRGSVERTMKDLSGPTATGDIRLKQFAAGKFLTALNAEGKLVLWNPLSGQIKPFPRS